MTAAASAEVERGGRAGSALAAMQQHTDNTNTLAARVSILARPIIRELIGTGTPGTKVFAHALWWESICLLGAAGDSEELGTAGEKISGVFGRGPKNAPSWGRPIVLALTAVTLLFVGLLVWFRYRKGER
jgi:hypothetical protein